MYSKFVKIIYGTKYIKDIYKNYFNHLTLVNYTENLLIVYYFLVKNENMLKFYLRIILCFRPYIII
jgi:hypothetical protein